MGRVLHAVEKGFRMYKENSDTEFIDVLFGSGAPGADGGEQDAAPVGSMYFRQNGASSTIYQKVASANNPSDWAENGSASAQLGNWRPERVDAHTGQILSAGNTDPTTWSDNDDGTTHAAFTIGNYVLDGNCDLWEITAISAPNITLAAAASAPVADDMFAVKFNMPDPAGQENQAIIVFDGSACIKVADVDWEFATGINLSGGYTPGSGDITSADSVESALEKLDGNNDDQDTLLGTSQGDVDLGTFSGVTIPDSSTVKGALQALETAYEETDQNVDDLITLSGVAENSTDLGTFTGVTIPDSSTVKGALQALETAYEETDQNVDDLITLSGVAENSTDLGVFAGNLLGDTETVKSALGVLEDAAEGFPEVQTGVSSPTVLDSVNVDLYRSAVWLVTSFDEANPTDVKSQIIHCTNDGTSGADASNIDDNVFSNNKLGGNYNQDIGCVLSGAGAAQVMQLQVDSSEPNVTYTSVLLGAVPSGY